MDIRAKLIEFAKNGGHILIFDEDLCYVEKVGDGEIWHFERLEGDDSEIRCKVIEVFSRFFNHKCMGGLKLAGEGAEKVYVVRRRLLDGWLWYFANTDEAQPFKGEADFDADSIILLNPENGDISSINDSKFNLKLEPATALLFYLPFGAVQDELNVPKTRIHTAPYESIELSHESWDFSINELNSLPLPIWKLEISYDGNTSVYHYTSTVYSDIDLKDVWLMLDDIEYRNAFMGLMDLVVQVNKRQISLSEKWYIDKGFHIFPIPEMPAGQNLIEVVIRHASWSGEPHLLTSPGAILGKFGVVPHSSGWKITQMPSKLRFESWNMQGYPFYSGTAGYSCEIEMPECPNGAMFRVDGVDACAELILDGISLGTRLWGPWEWEIPGTASCKKVKATLKVTNTLANFLGDCLPAGPRSGAYIDIYKS